MEPRAAGVSHTGDPMTHPTPVLSLPAGAPRRLGFRFLAAYLLLYNLEALLQLVPVVRDHSDFLGRGWNVLVLWTERVVLGMTTLSSLEFTGSGDTSFLWVRNGCAVVIALAAGIVWAFFDRKRRWDPTVAEALRIGVRYVVGYTLINYGISKLISPLQFPAPSGPRLLEPVGRLSPMGLLWTFMGASKAYTAFGGVMETVAGILLLWRRTTPLGAFLAAGVILNIVLLNFCYDVPVKLYSANLLLMAVFLLWPDFGRLSRVLVLNRPAEAASLDPPWKASRFRIVAAAAKVVILGAILHFGYTRYRGSGPLYKAVSSPVAQLAGLWDVEDFKSDGVVLPPLMTDRQRWRRVVFDPASGGMQLIAIGAYDQRLGFWFVAPASTEGKLVLTLDEKDAQSVTFVLVHSQPDRIELQGESKGHALVVKLHRASEWNTRLLTRGFHWVNETPFNR
jgi:uncharacterized membrane protein YphA (DoxX/SURF4 family)